MCDLCRVDGNYFHTAECVYNQLINEYPVMWLRMRYNEAVDEEFHSQCGDCIELLARADAIRAFEPFHGGAASV